MFLGAAFIDGRAGGRSAESRECIRNLALEHPQVIYAPLGLTLEGETLDHPPEVHEFTVQFYECLTDHAKAQTFITVWEGLTNSAAITGSDVVGVLNESEIACLREYFGDDRYDAFLGDLINSGDLGKSCHARGMFHAGNREPIVRENRRIAIGRVARGDQKLYGRLCPGA